MPAASDKAVAFVPPRHRWLVELYHGAKRAGLPLAAAVLADRVLRLTLPAAPGASALALTVRPAASEAPGFARTARFVLGFEGPGDAPAARAVLARLQALVAAADAQLPAELDGFAAIQRPTGHPEEWLRRLFVFLDIERSENASGPFVEALLRLTARCNQACPYCTAPQHADPAGEALGAAMTAVGRYLPGAMLTLSGGEPSLHPEFLDLVARALTTPGIALVQVQTNAVRFARAVEPAALAPDPRLGFFVSLHAVEPALYDRATGTTGQLPAALAGIRRILAAGHGVTLNTVVQAENVAHLGALIDALPTLFAALPRPIVHFSALICPERSPAAAQYLVPFATLVPALETARARALALGYVAEGLLDSTHAVVPACVLSPAARETARHRAALAPHETSHEGDTSRWVKAASCRTCREDPHCLGVPRPYAERFGLAELRPLTPEEP